MMVSNTPAISLTNIADWPPRTRRDDAPDTRGGQRPGRSRERVSRQILTGLALGIATGLFFGSKWRR
jgi:hypothetical protein